MSYNIMVFDGKTAPKKELEFAEWFKVQTSWNEDHGYNDPSVTTEQLRNWFMEMQKTFPQMNGPFALSDEEYDRLGDKEAYVTDYSIGRHIIYCSFAYSLENEARIKARELSIKYSVGFYTLSDSNPELLYPKKKLFRQ